ncbi:MAG TPA: hypothetical protein VGG16_29965 [Streptosporangiaceae bacterium]
MRSSRTVTAAITLAAAFGIGVAASFAGTPFTGTAFARTGAPASGSASWRIVEHVHSGSNGQFTAVTATGRSGGWAFNGVAGPSAWKLSGSSWAKAPFPKLSLGGQVGVAGATSPDDVWAFTEGAVKSTALRWNGSAWTVMHTFNRQIGGGVVLGSDDVWVFGMPYIPGAGLGAWHYNGHTWTQVSGGSGLEGGSGLSPSDIWAFDGADVAHWNGTKWTRASVASLLPARNQLNGPAVTGIYVQSANSVYAVGNGNQQDEGGPLVLLHYNGHSWTKVAKGNYGLGTQPLQQIAPDGHGGLWIPMPGTDGQKSYLLHYSGGALTPVALPESSSKINIDSVALIPGTSTVLAGGYTHAAGNDGSDVVSVILEYGS